MSEKFCVYETVTNKILEALDKGVIPWKHYLKERGNQLPINIVSSRPYRGSNVWLLALSPYASNKWGTYKQMLSKGRQVKKGEQGTFVIFWKLYERENKEGKADKLPILRYSKVFNEEQCEGYMGMDQPVITDFNPISEGERIIASFPLGFPKIQDTSRGSAFYRPTTDEIFVPSRDRFVGSEEYYGTVFHECIHATGHKSRLGRFEDGEDHTFGSNSYSKEELVAELGASFLCAHAGILPATIENSVAYISNWMVKLRNDKKLIVSASALAQRATDYLVGMKHENKEEE